MKLRRLFLLLLLFPMLNLFSHAEPLKVGTPAPVISGPSDSGTVINLGDVYAGQTYTLVYFYPKVDTPGCTKQGCSLRDAYDELTKKGVAVVGVSTDDVAAQRAFRAKFKFPFPLISDKEKKVTHAFGVPTTLGFAKRQAFLIKGGKIVWTDYSAATDKQAEDVLKAIAADAH
jgi:thioredoxin-dependent peroxiredoxin